MALITENKSPSKTRHCALLFIMILIPVMIFSFALKRKVTLHPIIVKLKGQSKLTKTEIPKAQKIRCIVVVKHVNGRLGNNMFKIASAYGLARLHSCQLYLAPALIKTMNVIFVFDLSPLLISLHTFNSIVHNSSKPLTRTNKSASCQYIVELTRPNAIPQDTVFELQGYWQSYLHFAQYADEIRERIFAPKQSVLERVSKLFINIYQEKLGFQLQFSLDNHQIFKEQLAQLNWTTWIGVHVRRRDFVHLKFSSKNEYLFFAIDYYTKLFSNAYFIVASDDKRYCRKLFGRRPNIFVTPQSFSPADDLIALSLCQNSIITGGTFGWWAGYLANGHVIHDKIYPSGCERREYYYPPWFLIDGHVRAQKNSNYTI